ncbi:MAG: phosphoribosyltransferase family protein [Gemmataceae bacterium]
MRTRIAGAQGEEPLASLFSATLRSSRVPTPVRDRSGTLRADYINGPALTADSRVLLAATNLLLPTVEAIGADALVGIELGGCALASALALMAAYSGRQPSLSFLRRTAKGYGYADRLTTPIPSGRSVLMIDDVVSTGATAAEAVAYLGTLGIHVKGLVVLISRRPESEVREIPLAVPVYYLLDSDAEGIASGRPVRVVPDARCGSR